MLLTFRVANFRSIRDEQELSLVRHGRLLGESPDTSERPATRWDRGISPVAALYGSNASGKSNLLLAINRMVSAVRDSYAKWPSRDFVPHDPFLLDAVHRHEPSRFEVELLRDEIRYQYGFELGPRQILREWLYAYPHGRRQVWYERDASAEEQWYFGKGLGGRNRVIAELTPPKALFLSAAGTSGHKRLEPIFHWLTRHFSLATSVNMRSRLIYTFEEVDKRDEVRAQLRRLLRHADLGIEDVQIRKKALSEEEKQRIMRVAKALAGEFGELGEEAFGEGLTADAWQKFSTVVELQHQCGDGSPPVGLPFESESMGTQALVSLVGPVLQALRTNSVLLVDEVDTSLHPQLVAELVRLFQSPLSNPTQAQLVFSTHETQLLGTLMADTPVLDRDQVWFVEKDNAGATSVYPLTDFSPRRQENLERGYLQGRYGAVPFFDNSEELIGTISTAESGD
jgi:uncharacterized protein